MSIFEKSFIDDCDASLIIDAVAAYVLKYGRMDFLRNLRRLLPFWDERLIEKGIVISRRNVSRFARSDIVLERIGTMKWNGSPEWNRDFFHGFFDASSTVYLRDMVLRAEIGAKPRYIEFLGGNLHGQTIRLSPHFNKSVARTSSLYFMEIKPVGNLEKYLCGVFSGGRPVHRGPEMRVSLRPSVRNVLDRLGIVYEEGIRRTALVSPFYIRLFNDEMPEPIASFWRETLEGVNYRNATVVAWMHWEQMFGRDKRRFLNGFPYLKSPQGSNRMGIGLEEVRHTMKTHRFDHVDSRIAERLTRWIEKQKEEKNGKCND